MNQRNGYPEEKHAYAYRERFEGHGVDQEKVKMFNRQLILQYLRDHDSALRVDMARSLGLSRATVTNIVKELKSEGFVREGKKMHSASTSGKLATEIHFHADAGYIVGIDLGRSRLRIYLTNLAATIIDQWVGVFDANVGWEKGLPYIALKVNELVERKLGTWTSVRGIGMGIYGSPDRLSATLISPPMLNYQWRNVDIPDHLRTSLKSPPSFPIYLDNDANMGALGECRYGEGYGVKHMIYIKLSTGIGAGLILDGQLYRGENGLAGEFGHVTVQFGGDCDKDSPVCTSCGKRGCLEALAGLHAIVRDAHRRSSSARPASIEETRITPECMANVIIEAQKGDEASRAALELAGTRIGTAIGSCLINVYNPALILLDGGIIRPARGGTIYRNTLLLDKLRQSAEASSLPAAWGGTKITTGKLGDDAVGLGAVATVIDRDPALTLSSLGTYGKE